MTVQMQMPLVTKSWVVDGRDCLIIQQPLGYLCGYVRADELRELGTEEEPICNLECHGGVTYSGTLDTPDVWWIGFDCAHAWDLIPGCYSTGTFKDEDYVTEECESLVQQLNHPRKAASFNEEDYRYAKSFFFDKNLMAPQTLEEFMELVGWTEVDPDATHGEVLMAVVHFLCAINVAIYPNEVKAIMEDLSVESLTLSKIIKALT